MKTNITSPDIRKAVKTLNRMVRVNSRGHHKAITIYNLVATEAQVNSDHRLKAVHEFLAAIRSRKRNSRYSGAKEFVVDALYKAVVELAEQSKGDDKDDTFLMS